MPTTLTNAEQVLEERIVPVHETGAYDTQRISEPHNTLFRTDDGTWCREEDHTYLVAYKPQELEKIAHRAQQENLALIPVTQQDTNAEKYMLMPKK